MPTVSLVCQAEKPTVRSLQALVETLDGQTMTDWELHLVVGSANQRHYQIAQQAVGGLPKVFIHQRSSQESLPSILNSLADGFGTWVGLLRVGDVMAPDALELMLTAATPETKILFSDEEAYDLLGTSTLRTDKRPINEYRLRSQEYIGSLALIQSSWLQSLKGFSLTSTEWPAHHIYLRTMGLLGSTAFTYVPAVCHRWFRRYTEPVLDRRRMHTLVGYDLEAVRQHLSHQGINAGTLSMRGILHTEYRLPKTPFLTVYVVLTNNSEANRLILRSVLRHLKYRATMVEIVFLGNNRIAEGEARAEVQGFGWCFHVTTDLTNFLNQELLNGRGVYAAVVQGEVFARDWDERALALCQQKGIGMVGGRVITGRHLTMPGTVGFKFAGADWNTEGPFGQLAVINNVAALSPVNCMLQVHTFIDAGGLDPAMGSLAWLDLCTRIRAMGLQLLYHPDLHVGVGPVTEPTPAEQLTFLGKHPGWTDPWGWFNFT